MSIGRTPKVVETERRWKVERLERQVAELSLKLLTLRDRVVAAAAELRDEANGKRASLKDRPPAEWAARFSGEAEACDRAADKLDAALDEAPEGDGS